MNPTLTKAARALDLQEARRLYRLKKRTKGQKRAAEVGASKANADIARAAYVRQALERGRRIAELTAAGATLAEAAAEVGMNYTAASRCKHAWLKSLHSSNQTTNPTANHGSGE